MSGRATSRRSPRTDCASSRPTCPASAARDNPADHSLGYRRRFVPAFMEALEHRSRGAHRPFAGGAHRGRARLAEPAAHHRSCRARTGSLLPPLGKMRRPPTARKARVPSRRSTMPAGCWQANLYNSKLVTEEAVQLRHRMSIGKNFSAFLARQADEGRRRQRRRSARGSAWRRCPVPLLMLYGEHDRGQAARRAVRAKQLNPQLDIRLLPRCGAPRSVGRRRRFRRDCGAIPRRRLARERAHQHVAAERHQADEEPAHEWAAGSRRRRRCRHTCRRAPVASAERNRPRARSCSGRAAAARS